MMETLQSIWTTLITENEFVANITRIPLSFIEVTITMLLFAQFLNISSVKKQKIMYIILFSTIASISNFLIPLPYNTFISVLACPILVFLIFKTTILKSILAEVFPFVAFLLIGSLVIQIYTFIFSISDNLVVSIPIHKLLYSLTLYLCIFLLYLLLKKFNINIQLLDKMKKKNTAILLLNFIVGSIAIIVQAYFFQLYTGTIPSNVLIINILALLIYFVISMYSLFRTNALEITAKNLEEEKLYNKTLTILYDNIRGFKHDFNNIVQAIGGYIAIANMNGLKEYYSQLLDDCQKVNSLNILSPEVINNPAIYSLLTSKYHKADEMGIKTNVEVFLDLNTLNMKIYELTRTLGILLDNAIEASSECEEKIINIVIRKDPKVNRQLFQIENTYKNKDIDTSKIFDKGYTSKPTENKKSHGLGLWEVRQILKKNNNLNLYTSKDTMYFKQQLEIYY